MNPSSSCNGVQAVVALEIDIAAYRDGKVQIGLAKMSRCFECEDEYENDRKNDKANARVDGRRDCKIIR